MRLNGTKCCFLVCKIELLGHHVVGNQILPQTHKLESVGTFVPRTVKDVQSILGVLGYFRKLIRSYTDLVKPIREVLQRAEAYYYALSSKLSAW